MAILTDNLGNLVTGVSVPITATGAANAGVTLTIAAPPSGQFVYLTSLLIVRVATAALAGGAVLVITTTNLPNALAYSTGNLMVAGGLAVDVNQVFDSPMKASAAATAVTIVCPVPGAAVLWRIVATYYYAA